MNSSTVGRPRKLTDTQIAEILEWHQSPRPRPTILELANRYQVSCSMIWLITSGYKHKRAYP